MTAVSAQMPKRKSPVAPPPRNAVAKQAAATEVVTTKNLQSGDLFIYITVNARDETACQEATLDDNAPDAPHEPPTEVPGDPTVLERLCESRVSDSKQGPDSELSECGQHCEEHPIDSSPSK